MNYRKKLGQIAREKIDDLTCADPDWTDWPEDEWFDQAAEAVAVKVLLDLSEHARTQYGDMYGLVIDDWAIEKGIDLIGDEG